MTTKLGKELRGLSREPTIATERSPFVGEVIANVCRQFCHVVSSTDPHGRILDF
jgi:hypothetical protein